MVIEHSGVAEINGPLLILDGVEGATNEEIVELRLDNGSRRMGRVVQLDGTRIVVQVFEGTRGLSLKNTRVSLTGHPMELALSPELLGRVFDGVGRPIDGLGEVYPERFENVNGKPIDPLKAPSEPAEPIAAQNRAAFEFVRDRIVAELDGEVSDSLRITQLDSIRIGQ